MKNAIDSLSILPNTLFYILYTMPYTRITKMGKGSFSTVYLGIETKTDKGVAIKQIEFSDEEQGVPANCIREISLLKELSGHPNIVTLLDVEMRYRDGEIVYLWLILERADCDFTTLTDEKLSAADVKKYMYQLLKGVEYCHSHCVIHRDLKTANLLLGADGQLKITDFGLARIFSVPMRPMSNRISTLWYRAPEIILGENNYSLGVDMWSVGCIFAELATSKVLFKGDSEMDQLYKIFGVMGTPTPETWPGMEKLPHYAKFTEMDGTDFACVKEHLSDDGMDLLRKILTYTPEKRITARDALQHPYFDEVR